MGRGGETVCLTRIQAIDYDSFFWLRSILLHILPNIKISVIFAASHLRMILLKRGLAAERRGLRLEPAVYLISWCIERDNHSF